MKYQLSLLFVLLFCGASLAQPINETERKGKVWVNGRVVTALITETDTIVIADLEEISVSAPRKFNSKEEYRLYRKYRYYSAKVYPYAVDAIRIFRELDHVTKTMSKRKRKKHVKRLQRKLKKDFKKPLKNLSKTQGKILIKMIEKELDRPFYNLVKDLRGGFTAAYWNQLGKLYGYRIKRGYIVGDDPILDLVLRDFNVTHDAHSTRTP